MGLQTVPAYIGKTGYTHPVETDRNVLRTIGGARTGLTRFGDFAVTPTGVSGQISIARGAAFLLGVESNLQGAYHVWSDAAVTASFAAASGNPRIDSLILRVSDDQYGTIPGSPQAYFEVVQGVASGSPVARADSYFNSGGGGYVPGAWYRVADVRRNLGDTTIPAGQITHNLQYSRYSIGDQLIANGSSFPSDAKVKDEVVRSDNGLRYWYDGTVWIPTAGQLVYGFVRGLAQANGTKILSNQVGVQTAFTTPVINIDQNMVYYLTASCYMSSGSVNPKKGKMWLDRTGGGGSIMFTGHMQFDQGETMRLDFLRYPYMPGAVSTMQFDFRVQEMLGTAYDVESDPDTPIYLYVETTGWKASQFAS